METKEMKCQAGCIAFSGMEIKHHHDCVHYPGSMSKIYDRLKERNASQQQTIERLKETLDGLLDDFKYYISQMDEEPQRAGYMLEAEQLLSTTEPIDQNQEQ